MIITTTPGSLDTYGCMYELTCNADENENIGQFHVILILILLLVVLLL